MSLSIFIRRAGADIRQHLGTQLVTTLVVVLSVLIFSFFALLHFNLQRFVERFGGELGVVVYLDGAVPQKRVPMLYQELTKLEGVETVRYIAPEEALGRLKAYLRDEPEVLEGVDAQFLPPSFEIQIDRAVYHLPRIRQLAKQIAGWSDVARVQYGQEWLHRLEVFSRLARGVVVAAGMLLLFTAAFGVANTIKLTVYARQNELEILRLVGATNTFIQGPFLLEALLQGLIGALLAVGITYGSYRSLQGLIAGSDLLRGVSFTFLPWLHTAAIVGSSILLCVIGTALAIRRVLRL